MRLPNPASPTAPGTPSAPSGRVFLALWLPADLAATLSGVAQALTRECGGRPSRADTLHLTLAFVGDMPPGQLDRLRVVVPALRGTAFRLVLDRVGLWRHNGIAWAAPSVIPAPLAALRQEAQSALDLAGIPFDRRPFRPHVTLARRVERTLRAPPDLGELGWDVSELVLVRSGRDARGAARYDVLATCALEESPRTP